MQQAKVKKRLSTTAVIESAGMKATETPGFVWFFDATFSLITFPTANRSDRCCRKEPPKAGPLTNFLKLLFDVSIIDSAQCQE